MAARNVCRYFKFGHCKYSERCRFMHIKQICEKENCEIQSCNLRHPRICKFYRDYNRCKFSEWCSFKHIENENTVATIKEILEKLESLQKTITEKDKLIINLARKIEDIEEQISKKEETVNEDAAINTISETIEESSFECDKCGFISKNNHGLNIHKKKKHGKKLKCDLCDKEFDSKRFLEIHTKAHSYNKQKRKYVCDKCEFECTTLETLEVHSGKCCNENIECGLCELRFENLEVLEIHLTTCEIYECADCLEKYKCLSDMKNHIKEEHENGNGFNHMKMDREDNTKVNFKAYAFSEV